MVSSSTASCHTAVITSHHHLLLMRHHLLLQDLLLLLVLVWHDHATRRENLIVQSRGIRAIRSSGSIDKWWCNLMMEQLLLMLRSCGKLLLQVGLLLLLLLEATSGRQGGAILLVLHQIMMLRLLLLHLQLWELLAPAVVVVGGVPVGSSLGGDRPLSHVRFVALRIIELLLWVVSGDTPYWDSGGGRCSSRGHKIDISRGCSSSD